MDYKFVKPAAKSTVIVFLFIIAYLGLFFALNAIDHTLVSHILSLYLLFGLLIGFFSIPLMGFLGAYFYRKEAKRLTMGDCILVALTPLFFLTLLVTLIYVALYGYPIYYIYFLIIFAYSLLISVVGSIFGSFLGAILLMTKEEKEKWGIKLVYIWVYVGLVMLLAAAVILWQMGSIGPPPATPGCTGFSQVKPSDWKASYSTGNLTLTLFNDAETQINLTDVNVSVFNIDCTPGAHDINQVMSAGNYYQLDVSNCSYAFSSLSVGDYYKADITIVYSNMASSIGHNSVGECHGTVED